MSLNCLSGATFHHANTMCEITDRMCSYSAIASQWGQVLDGADETGGSFGTIRRFTSGAA